MEINLSKQRTDSRAWVMSRIVYRVVPLTAMALVVLLSSCNDNPVVLLDSNEQHDTEHATVQPTGQSSTQSLEILFTDSNQDIWPPQPLNISNVQKIQHTVTTKSTQLKSNDTIATKAKATILHDANLVAELGDHYATLASHEITDQSGNLTSIETEFFIYTSNKVLTAILNLEGTQSVTYTLTEASNYQPPESQQEVKSAIALAAVALNQQGYIDHKLLIGTALLAYPTAAEVSENGNQFFSSRKLYVTFGPGKGKAPRYRALVNLSNSVVEHSGSMQ